MTPFNARLLEYHSISCSSFSDCRINARSCLRNLNRPMTTALLRFLRPVLDRGGISHGRRRC